MRRPRMTGVPLDFLQRPEIRPMRRRRPSIDLAASFIAGFAVAMLLVAIVR